MTFGLVARLAADRLARLPGIFTVAGVLTGIVAGSRQPNKLSSSACDGRHGAA
jgi:hypothetical protein